MSTRVYVNVNNLAKKLKLAEDVVREELTVLLKEASEIGANASKSALDKASTEWGRGRMSGIYRGRPVKIHGNSDGRNDTGEMISKLYAFKPNLSLRNIFVKFGWVAPKKYYRYQEEGTSRIKAANSLLTGKRAVINALPRLEAQMKKRFRMRMAGK